jgi:hypothetical protein
MYVMIPSGSRPLGLLYAFMLLYVACDRRVLCLLFAQPLLLSPFRPINVESKQKKKIHLPKSSHQMLATLALPSGTLAWQTISFKLVPHSWHSASSALSRQILPLDDGPIPGPAALS